MTTPTQLPANQERENPMTSAATFDEQQIRIDVVEAARLMWERGYVSGTEGNVSARLGASGKLLITPSDTLYPSLKPGDLVLCSMQFEPLNGEASPSIELPLHAAIYCARPDVGAIIHTHSHHATSAAFAGSEIPILIDDAVHAVGSDRIPCAAFAPFGTNQLAQNAVAALGSEGKALLLAEHGTLAVGAIVQEAFAISEMIEKAAKVFMLSVSDGEGVEEGGRSKKK